uniref:Uncharacterized protein n=1 Tax=viral metagenome TaxID=1070528 RepID=A0A6M3LG52_9ZZZZ
MKDTYKTKVVFRAWKGLRDFGVIALFPEEDAGLGHCSSYERVGQHGGANYSLVISRTRPAKPSEYADLRLELSGLGYNLLVIKRRPR